MIELRGVWQRARRLAVTSVCCILLHVTSAEAETAAWTLPDAERSALTRSPRLRSARAARDTAHAFQAFATLPRIGNPFVNVRAMVGWPDDAAATYALLVGLPFDVGGKRAAYRGEARHVVEEANARLSAAHNEVLAEVRAAYAELVFAEALRALARERAETAGELLSSVQTRFAAGAVTAIDLTMAEAQLAEAEAQRVQEGRRIVQAESEFRRVLDLPPHEPTALTALPAPTLPEGLSKEQAIERALAQRREATAWASAGERWRKADRRLRAEAVGPLHVGLELERQGNRASNSSLGASVGAELPIVQKNQGERAIARKEAHAADVERELVEHEITREVVSSYELLASALAEVAMLEARALPAAERTLSMVKTLLESGAVDYFRLLSARSNAFALRARRVDALREAWLHRIALARALGDEGSL